MKLVDLVPLKEIDFNDPALMRARAAKDQMSQIKPNPRIGFDQALDLRGEKQDLEQQISNLYREMESDPDIEPEGGPVADQYGDTLNRLETRLYKINKEIASYDMSEGEDEDDEQDMADVKDDIASMMNEATEKSWNSIDVSRKAEKEIGNKEWNERTTKKLDMLIALNKAGKFKKDFDEERLQGWVDQNYSWEKLSRQFKLNESKNSKMKGKLLTERFQELAGIKPLYEADPEAIKGKHYPDDETVKKLKKGPYTPGGQNAHTNENYTKQSLLKALGNADDAFIQLSNGRELIIYNPNSNNDENADMWNDDVVYAVSKDGDEVEVLYSDIAGINLEEIGMFHDPLGYEPEDLDNPDEDLVIIGSGYLDIKSNFGERPSMTNGEYAELGQKVVDQLHNGDKEAALDYIYSQINEGSCGYGPDGVPGDTPGETRGMPADTRTRIMMREAIKKEIKRLHENK